MQSATTQPETTNASQNQGVQATPLPLIRANQENTLPESATIPKVPNQAFDQNTKKSIKPGTAILLSTLAGITLITIVGLFIVPWINKELDRRNTYSVTIESPSGQQKQVAYAELPETISTIDTSTAKESGLLASLLRSKKIFSSDYCDYQFAYPNSWMILSQQIEHELESALLANQQITTENLETTLKLQIGCAPINQNESTDSIIKSTLARYDQSQTQFSERKTAAIKNGTSFYYDIKPGDEPLLREYYIFRKPGQVIILTFSPLTKELAVTAEDLIQTLEVGE